MRVKGGEVEYRLTKSVLRVQRSWETQRSDLKSMTLQSAVAKGLRSPRRSMASCCPSLGVLQSLWEMVVSRSLLSWDTLGSIFALR